MPRGLLKLATGVASVLISTTAWAQAPSDIERYAWGPHMWWGGGWYPMLLGPLFMILFLAVVITAVGLLIRWQSGQTTLPYHTPPGRSPLDILKERFARGEIDKNEFEERRRVLGE